MIDASDVIFHYFVYIGQMRDWFSCFVDDEAGAALIWKVFDAFGGDYFDKFDMSIFFGDRWEMHVDEVAEFIAVLIEMQEDEGLWVCFGDFSNILIS